MKICLFCNKEIDDNAIFCDHCGKKQEAAAASQAVIAAFCANCGAKLQPGDVFCKECGTRVVDMTKLQAVPNATVPQQPVTPQPQAMPNATVPQQPVTPQPQAVPQPQAMPNTIAPKQVAKNPAAKKDGSATTMIVVFAVVIVLCLLGAIFMFAPQCKSLREKVGLEKKTANADTTATASADVASQAADATTVEGDPAQGDSAQGDTAAQPAEGAVTYDLTQNTALTFSGQILKLGDDEYYIELDAPFSVYGSDEKGNMVTISDQTIVYMDDVNLDEGVLESVNPSDYSSVEGSGYISEGKLYVKITKLHDSKNKDLIKKYKQDALLQEDYILPQSEERLLTKADIKGLTLQEINYAKNEIYARHGRLFQSQELQDYFDGKDWYDGYVDPEDFSESCLSDIELKNASFLSKQEFKKNPKGYQLDK